MGNIFKCCQMLEGFFRCHKALQDGDAERSPLLSEEDTECESLTLWDDPEQDLLTNPTLETSTTLERGHFLFPDIVLSSSLGVDSAEPSACLLVTKDDQARGAEASVREDERTDGEKGEGMDEGRERLCSEVETQTESGIQTAMEAQTQTEAQTETQTQTQADNLMETDNNIELKTQSLRHIAKESDCLSDVQNQLDIMVGIQAGKRKTSQTQTHTQLLTVTDLNTVNAEQTTSPSRQTVLTEYADEREQRNVLTAQTDSQREQNEDQTEQNPVLMERNTDQTQQNMDLTEPSQVLRVRDHVEPSIRKSKQKTEQMEWIKDPGELDTDQTEQETDPRHLDTDQTEPETDPRHLDTDQTEPETDQTEQETDPRHLDTDQTEPETDPRHLDTDQTEQETDPRHLDTDQTEPETDPRHLNTDQTEQETDQTEQETDPRHLNTVQTEQETDQTEQETDPRDLNTDQTEQETDQTEQETDPRHLNTDQTEQQTDQTEQETDPRHLNTDQTEQETDQTEQETDPRHLNTVQTEQETDQTEQETDPRDLNTDQTEQETDQTEQETDPRDLNTDQTEQETDQTEQETDPRHLNTDQTEQETDQTEQETDPRHLNTDQTEQETDQTEQETDPRHLNTDQTEQETDQTEQETDPRHLNTDQTEQETDQTEQETDPRHLNTDQTEQETDQTEQETDPRHLNTDQTEQETDQTEQETDPRHLDTDRTEQETDPRHLDTDRTEQETDPRHLNTDQTEQETDPRHLNTDQTEQETDPKHLDTDRTKQETDQTEQENNPRHLDNDLTEQETEQILQDADELKQAAGVEDGAAESKQITLFMVDKLFLAAPHITGPPSVNQPVEEPKDKETNVDEGEDISIQEVIRLQEEEFTVRIQAPGSETFDLQVSGTMQVLEVQQVLLDHELTCHRTCFSLQLEGATLDGLTELHSIPSLQGALLKVVEDPYTVRDARLHLRHVRDLLRGLDPTDAHNGLNGSSLSYLSLYTQGDMETGARKGAGQDSPNYTPPDYILPGSKDRPLMPLHPMREDRKPLQCLRVLTVSSWNPPPGNRKMHGDLMYLNAVTMEDKHLNITASTRGFYLNQSTAFTFNPKPAAPKFLCHSLVELLSQVSPTFRKNFNTLQKMRVLRHPYERIATPFQVFTWTAPLGDHALNCVRAEETHTSRMGQDEHTAGQSRDWNEELQAGRELPRRNLQERLLRERTLFKTNSDFLAAARRGAMAVVDGNVMAINPGEEPRMQMFIWNSLFFSLGFDVRDHYHSLGGDAAAHAAATCDLRGVQAYAALDIDGLHTLGTAVLDYRGYRVTAQTIVPGVLDKDQEQSVVYGSNDYGKTVLTHPRFVELLNSTSGPMRVQRHLVLDHTHLPVELCSSVETKGILGNDGRRYILDLIRSYPPDLNFRFSEEGAELQEDFQRPGFPKQHPHSLASLRPELLEAFIQHRYDLFLKMVASRLNQEEVSEAETGNGSEADSRLAEDTRKRAVIQKACKAVGSVSDSCFDIRFNPNIITSGVRFPAELSEDIQKQRQLLMDVSVFLLSNQIPSLIRDFLDYTVVVMDGGTLTAELHERGVNVRYLGTLLEQLENTGEEKRLGHVQRVAIGEVIIRSAKHIFKAYLQGVEPSALSAAVSHFLNCLLSSSSSTSDSASYVPPDELLSRRKSRRRRSHGNRVAMVAESIWARLTPSDLWSKIKAEAERYYHYTLRCENIDKAVEKYSLQKISLLREMAIKTGIQVQLREYVFESRQRLVFNEEDVINMFPVVKHLSPTASDATRLIQQSQATIHQGLLHEGCELIRQALALFSNVCGVLHKDVSVCLRLLGRLCYLIGDYNEALSHQERATLITERVQGIDHTQTIQDYIHLALYCFTGGQISTSLRMLYRARYLSLLVMGEDHPQVALLDSMVGLVLYGLLEYDLSLKFLQNTLTLTLKYHGATSLKHAQSHHMLAMVFECKGDFRSALQHEKEAHAIYKKKMGDGHESVRESSEYLESLTQQAVTLQRAINHIYSSASSTWLPPLKFSTPSLAVILQQLNLVCGIILVPLSNKDLKQLRADLKGNREERRGLIQELDGLMNK